MAEASAEHAAARARLAEADSRIALEVRQRRHELEAAAVAVAAERDAVRAATEAHRVVAERFGAGVATTADVLDAEVAVLEAGLGLTRALSNVRLAEAQLARAVGR